MSEPFAKFLILPKYKKNFVEFTKLEKQLENGEYVYVTEEMVWRFGEIIVNLYESDFKQICEEHNLTSNLIHEHPYEFFKQITNDNTLTFNEDFPFEYEFVGSYDGCCNDHYITYSNPDKADKTIEYEIYNILDVDGFNELEEKLDFMCTDCTYEIYDDFELEKYQ